MAPKISKKSDGMSQSWSFGLNYLQAPTGRY